MNCYLLLTIKMKHIGRQTQVPMDPRSSCRVETVPASLLGRHHRLMPARGVPEVSTPANTSSCRHMMQPLPTSKSMAMPVMAMSVKSMPVKAASVPAKVATCLVEASHLTIRRGMPGTILGVWEVTRAQTVMMTVTRP